MVRGDYDSGKALKSACGVGSMPDCRSLRQRWFDYPLIYNVPPFPFQAKAFLTFYYHQMSRLDFNRLKYKQDGPMHL